MPIKEEIVQKKIEENLKNIGWQLTTEDTIKPHQTLDNYIVEEIFLNQLEKINDKLLSRLTNEEKEQVLINAKNIFLRETSPIKALNYLKFGIKIEILRGKKGKEIIEIKLIDYKNPQNNIFQFSPEVKYKGTPRDTKPDFTLFINGIPIVIIEAKREFAEEDTYIKAINQVLDYEKRSPKLFNFVQFAVAYGDKKGYFPTFPNPDKEKRTKKLEVWRNENKEKNIFHLLEPLRVLEIIKNFTFFIKKDGKLNKIIPRYPQYYAVKKAFLRIKNYIEGKDYKNKGLIWHWQGSGKSYEILYLTDMFMEQFIEKNPHVFVMIDRQDLEKQLNDELFTPIENTFFKSYYKKIESIKELKGVIENIKSQEENSTLTFKGVYLVMMHKFKQEQLNEFLENYEEIKKKEILILRDEAHRTEYGLLATVRNAIFKNALRFGFTGTPINKIEKNTFQEYAYPQEKEFYLDKFFIEDSLKDEFTLPLVCRAVLIDNLKLNITEEEIKNILIQHQLDENVEIDEKKVKEKLKISDLLSAEDRIKKAVEYIAENIENDTEGFKYKVFIVAHDRLACVRYKKYLDEILTQYFGEEAKNWSQIVMTYQAVEGQQEIEEYKNYIETKYNQKWEDLNKRFSEEFKSPDNPLKILIVTNMLLEGYDAPILKVMYFDKLTSDQRLLQASARANRTRGDKKFGLIVDLTGVLIENYKKALSQYNIYEDEEIKEDLAKHAFVDAEEIWKSFLENYEEFKNLFYKITRINWEDFSEQLGKGEINKEKYEEIIGIIASHPDVNLLLSQLKETIDLYKAVGTYPDKLKYTDTFEWLKILYYNIKKLEKPKKTYIPWNEIKKELIDKLSFNPFEEIGEIKLDEESIEKLKSEKKAVYITANLLYSLMEEFEDKTEPLYKELYDRLKDIKNRFIKRQEKVKNILKELYEVKKQEEEYKQKTEGLKASEKIIYNLIKLLQLKGFSKVKLEKTKIALKKIENRKVIPSTFWNELKKSLHMDLRLTIKDIKERDKLIELLVEEYIKPLLEKREND